MKELNHLHTLVRHCPRSMLSAQSERCWRGPFPLPKTLIEYYRHFGPFDLEIGMPTQFFFPCLADLWQYQVGFGYDLKNQSVARGWHHDWLVIGDHRGRPLIFSVLTEKVLLGDDCRFAFGNTPVILFQNIRYMVNTLSVISQISGEVGARLCAPNGEIKPRYKEEAFFRLADNLGDLNHARFILAHLYWQ